MPWDPTLRHGWPVDPWLPFPPECDHRSVADERADPTSVLHLYRRLLTARRGSPALQSGDQRLLDAPEGVLGWVRSAATGDEQVVLVNFTNGPVALAGTEALAASDGWTIEVASDGIGEGSRFVGVLSADQALVLRRGPIR
jgi:alpha-glucosidase